MNLHEIEERDFGRGPALWDADPEVCCAAFQLGCCPHTEADAYDEDEEPDEIGLVDEVDYEDWAAEKIAEHERSAAYWGEEPF